MLFSQSVQVIMVLLIYGMINRPDINYSRCAGPDKTSPILSISLQNPDDCKQVLRKCTFLIDGEKVTLKKGFSEEKIVKNSASVAITKYAGFCATGDISGDGRKDVALILSRESGGSGTFYYVAAAVSQNKNYEGTNTVFIGDRIGLNGIGIEDGEIIVSYSDRKNGEPMQSKPSVEMSKVFVLKSGRLAEVVESPGLTGKQWKWTKTTRNNGETVSPKEPDSYLILFNDDGSMRGYTDCNSISGKYQIDENKLKFGPLISTRKYCEGSQENIFMKDLTEVDSYYLDENKHLILQLKDNGGSLIFH